jgi:integrase
LGEVLKRGNGWTLRFYEQGRRRVIASKQRTFADARRMLHEIEARIARSELGLADRPTSWPSVAVLIDQFLSEYSRPKLKDLDQYRARTQTVLRKVLPVIGSLSVGCIQPSDVAKLRDRLGQHVSAGTVRNTLMCLSAVFSWAVRTGRAPLNPCRGIEKPQGRESLDFLSRDEVAALIQCCVRRAQSGTIEDQLQQARVLLALHTGLRKGELCGLRWCDLDLVTCRLTVSRSYASTPKSGKTRHLRLPDAVLPSLSEWATCCPVTPQGLVFPHRGRNGWAMSTNTSDLLDLPDLLTSAGCRPLTHPWHALRHTFASHFVMSGGNILTLQKILGHSDLKMTLIYAHLAPDFLGDEMNRLKFT